MSMQIMRETLAKAGVERAETLVMAYGPGGKQVYMIEQGDDTRTFVRPAGEMSDETTRVLISELAG